MINNSLTQEQLAAVNMPEAVFIKACPGAGKTRVVVARLKKMAETLPLRRGIAVLSFTHSAVDEFRERCAKEKLAHVLEHPGFIGTFDSFLRQFVVLPSGIPGCARYPRVLDSWGDLGIKIRLRGKFATNSAGVSLDRFDSETLSIDPESLRWDEPKDHVIQFRDLYEKTARSRRQALQSAGLLSNACMRLLAKQKLLNPSFRCALGKMIAARFAEVIVDEAQDCNELDLRVLHWLHRMGVSVSVVCDPDQSIYGFRRGDPGNLGGFEALYSKDARLRLTGNFRSTQPICRLAGTLRSSTVVDRSLVEEENPHCIVVVPFRGLSPIGVGARFRQSLGAAGILPEQAIVLAHKWTTALAAVGERRSQELPESGRVPKVAKAIGDYWSPFANSRGRERAIRMLEYIVLDGCDLLKGAEHPTDALVQAGMEPRRFRRQMTDLLTSIPRQCLDDHDAQDVWVRGLQDYLRGLGLPWPKGRSARISFPKPKGSKWVKLLYPVSWTDLRAGSIHEAKGHEYEAVCVVIPRDQQAISHTSDLLHSWQQRLEDESKRVLYVGVTRAKRFLLLALPEEHLPEVQRILEAGEVPFRVDPVSEPPRIARRSRNPRLVTTTIS